MKAGARRPSVRFGALLARRVTQELVRAVEDAIGLLDGRLNLFDLPSSSSHNRLAMGQFGSAWAGRVIQGPALSGAPWMSGIEQLAEMITTDLEQRLPGQRKTQRDKLALLVATMLQVRSANLMDVAACLPRPAERLDSRYQWIKRFLANTHVVSEAVMAPYGREVLTRLSAQGQTVVLLIDQTQVNERHQAVMVAVRLGGRALPLTWRVKETQG